MLTRAQFGTFLRIFLGLLAILGLYSILIRNVHVYDFGQAGGTAENNKMIVGLHSWMNVVDVTPPNDVTEQWLTIGHNLHDGTS